MTCEVTPHHFVLTDDMLASPEPYDTNVKMNPPLRYGGRSRRDAPWTRRWKRRRHRDRSRAASLRREARRVRSCAVRHHRTRKRRCRSVFAIASCYAGAISIARLVELLSVNPARILRLPGGSLGEGAPADITILAPDLQVTVSVARMQSKSKNTPFDGWALRGGVAATIVGGRTVYVNEDAGSGLLELKARGLRRLEP